MNKPLEITLQILMGIFTILVFIGIFWLWANGWVGLAIAIITPILIVAAIWGVIRSHIHDKGYEKGWDEANKYYKDKNK